MGVAIFGVGISFVSYYAAVANSGDASISIYQLQGNQVPTTIQGIPDPHAVILNCGRSTFFSPAVIVTSPSDNSVSFIQFPSSGLVSNPSITKISVGK
jgi:hypothetical protein